MLTNGSTAIDLALGASVPDTDSLVPETAWPARTDPARWNNQYAPPASDAISTPTTPTIKPVRREWLVITESATRPSALTPVRTMPPGVASNAHASTSATGNPIRMSTTTSCSIQFGNANTGNTCVATWISNQPITA